MQRMGVQLKPQFSSRTRAGNLANIQQPASKPTEMNRTSRRLPALLFGLLVCLVAQTAGRPSTEDVSDMAIIPPDADNVEIHQVKFVNGVMQEDHPVIMYKEDFVSEDYVDPTKNETSSGRYKKHKRTHHHRAETQLENEGERILFDVLPDKPIVLSDDLKTLPVSKMEAAQLAEPIKLGKLPKKYHSRQRRDLHNKHQKVIPVYLYNFYPVEKNFLTYRPPVSNKKPKLTEKKNRRYKPTNYLKPDQSDGQNPDDVNTRGEFDLIHDSDPKNADHSVYNQSTTSKTPLFSIMDSAPVGGPIFGVQVPDNDDRGADLVPLAGFSPPGFAPPPASASRPIARRPSFREDSIRFPQEIGYQAGSNCQRASKYCCGLRNYGSQYDCFQHYDCHESLAAIISSCS
ncbi:uncharacterized protein LOC128266589 isoform X5 [Drosophila gunungcola]|uniref:uncharacterized protein LOC128266589 isoform X5 n=1 Tax=Drosophila gunungcola TaxID=103775 RepID=UPI0022E5F8DE|nr:uncharacterized protein LOC128266589 isoform X5 [Drosophila gunungcola]